MGPDTLRTLRVWKEGMALVKDSYALSAGWPKSELFGLTGQVRRAAISIPANLAEGKGRGSAAELVRYARIWSVPPTNWIRCWKSEPNSSFPMSTLSRACANAYLIWYGNSRPTSNQEKHEFFLRFSHDPQPTTHNLSC